MFRFWLFRFWLIHSHAGHTICIQALLQKQWPRGSGLSGKHHFGPDKTEISAEEKTFAGYSSRRYLAGLRCRLRQKESRANSDVRLGFGPDAPSLSCLRENGAQFDRKGGCPPPPAKADSRKRKRRHESGSGSGYVGNRNYTPSQHSN
jgi:hypothetical protein